MNGNLLKYFFMPIVLFIAAIVMVFWVLMPLYGDIQAASDLKTQNENNLNDRIKLVNNLEQLINQYNNRINDVASFSKAIPESQNVPELLINLEALASENGMTFSGVDFKPKDLNATGVKTLIMGIKVKGSYANFKRYIGAMESSIRIFDVTNVSFAGIAPGEANARTDSLEFNLTVNTYYY